MVTDAVQASDRVADADDLGFPADERLATGDRQGIGPVRRPLERVVGREVPARSDVPSERWPDDDPITAREALECPGCVQHGRLRIRLAGQERDMPGRVIPPLLVAPAHADGVRPGLPGRAIRRQERDERQRGLIRSGD